MTVPVGHGRSDSQRDAAAETGTAAPPQPRVIEVRHPDGACTTKPRRCVATMVCQRRRSHFRRVHRTIFLR